MRRFLSRLRAVVTNARPRPCRKGSRRPELTPLEDRRLLSVSKLDVVVHPRVLTPPNGEYLPVTVSGSFQESAKDAAPNGYFYVTDQYGTDEPRAAIPVTRSPTDPTTYTFTFSFHLQAKRGSMTPNGRQYDILVGARDAAGTAFKTIVVVVPKDTAPAHPHGPKPAVHRAH